MKIFYPNKEQLKDYIFLNEDQWFDLFQPLLVKMANTDYGKSLLSIPSDYQNIFKITKNSVSFFEGGKVKTDFRIGSKWANVIRYRWEDFKLFAKTFYETKYMGGKILTPYLQVNGQLVASNATDTFYPDPNPETTTVDGKVWYFSLSGPSWTVTVQPATNGTAAAPTASEDYLQNYLRTGSNTGLTRGFFLFDTSSIDDSNTIDSATLSFYVNSKNNENNDGYDYQNIFSSTPASNTDLVTEDYDQIGSTKFSSDVDYGSISATAYLDFSLNASGLANISKTGVSKFSTREGHDVDNVAPSASGDGNYLYIRLADYTGTTSDPKLVVTHSAAASRNSNLLLLGIG